MEEGRSERSAWKLDGLRDVVHSLYIVRFVGATEMIRWGVFSVGKGGTRAGGGKLWVAVEVNWNLGSSDFLGELFLDGWMEDAEGLVSLSMRSMWGDREIG